MPIHDTDNQIHMRYACPYYRKSTGKQELSLEVQQEAVHSFVSAKNWHILKEFTEVERCASEQLKKAYSYTY